MHRLSASFVLGYHGCDRAVGQRLLDGERFVVSENDYDWLGSGIYFWEANPVRGLEFARELQFRSPDKITDPYVVGAVIDCGYCLNLMESRAVEAVVQAYGDLKVLFETAGRDMPENVHGKDLLLRRLDCAVVNHLHELREAAKQEPFETVKGLFREGDEIYALSGFHYKSHIQICVRDPNCIKGVFRVRGDHLGLTNGCAIGYA